MQKFQSKGEIDAVLRAEHFPHVLVSRVPPCNDCEDYYLNISCS